MHKLYEVCIKKKGKYKLFTLDKNKSGDADKDE